MTDCRGCCRSNLKSVTFCCQFSDTNGTTLPLRLSLVEGAAAILNAHYLWHPNDTDLARLDLSPIEAQAAHVTSDMESWNESGVKLDSLIRISVLGNPISGLAAQGDQEACAKDCENCDLCQGACMTLMMCLPCCMFLYLLHRKNTHAMQVLTSVE